MPRPNWKQIAINNRDKVDEVSGECLNLQDQRAALAARVKVLEAENLTLNKLAIRDAAAHHMIIEAGRLGNIAYSALAALMDHELGSTQPDLTAVVEGQALLEFKKAIVLGVDYIIVRVTRDDPV